MCWNPYVERLYIGFHVINDDSNNQDQGMRGLLVGRMDADQKLCFDNLVPDNALINNKSIVGNCGAQKTIPLTMLNHYSQVLDYHI